MIETILAAAMRSSLLILAVGVGLKALRVKNPHVLMSVWRLVLAASMLTLLVVDRPVVTLPPATFSTPFAIWSQATSLHSGPASSTPTERASDGPTFQAEPMSPAPSVNWRKVGSEAYLLVAGAMLLRLLIGGVLSLGLLLSASPIRELWTLGKDVRVSERIKTPGTFGSLILLPADYASWNETELKAVMAHEEAHVRRYDFYILLLASIHRSIFWFNPFAWRLNERIALLAEETSDAAAIESIADRLRYAQILVDLSRNPGRAIGLAMAKPGTVRRRVEEILAQTTLPKTLDWKKWATIVTCIVPLAAVVTGAVAQAPGASDATANIAREDEARAKRLAEQESPRTEIKIDPKLLEAYVGSYRFDVGINMTISRKGDQLLTQLPGQPQVPIYPESERKFFAKVVHAQISFDVEPNGRVTGLVLHQVGLEQRAPRLEKGEAEEAARQIAKRMKDAIPLPGSEAALRRQIDTLQQGKPDYEAYPADAASFLRSQASELQRQLTALGVVKSMSFLGVGQLGWDIYDVRFANGFMVARIHLASNGKVDGLLLLDGP